MITVNSLVGMVVIFLGSTSINLIQISSGASKFTDEGRQWAIGTLAMGKSFFDFLLILKGTS
jgi:hypothetical protein